MAGLTKLRAVNIMLENIGESPVNTLTGSGGDAFVATAISILDETARDVCAEVWNFNKDTNYAMVPDVSNNIVIASNMIAVDGTYPTDEFQVRQGKLYDMVDQTFTFTETQYCDIIWEFEYDDLPQHVRKYTAIVAARVFSRRILGDGGSDRITEQDELRARTRARRHDSKNRDRTIWQDYGSGTYRLKQRRLY